MLGIGYTTPMFPLLPSSGQVKEEDAMDKVLLLQHPCPNKQPQPYPVAMATEKAGRRLLPFLVVERAKETAMIPHTRCKTEPRHRAVILLPIQPLWPVFFRSAPA